MDHQVRASAPDAVRSRSPVQLRIARDRRGRTGVDAGSEDQGVAVGEQSSGSVAVVGRVRSSQCEVVYRRVRVERMVGSAEVQDRSLRFPAYGDGIVDGGRQVDAVSGCYPDDVGVLVPAVRSAQGVAQIPRRVYECRVVEQLPRGVQVDGPRLGGSYL